MKNHPKPFALTALVLGCITLIVPVFTPPDTVYPVWLSFTPYAVLAVALFVARSRCEQWSVVAVSVLTLLTEYFFLDSILFHQVFSWQIVGLVIGFLPLFQMALGVPTFAVLALRRWRMTE